MTFDNRKFIVRLRKDGPNGPIVANSRIITVDSFSNDIALPKTFTEPTLGQVLNTSSRLAWYTKIINKLQPREADLKDLNPDYFVCNPDPTFIFASAVTTGIVYGGGSGSPYSEDSDPYAAALHAGKIQAGDEYIIERTKIKYYRDEVTGQDMFIGSTANGITTYGRREGCGYELKDGFRLELDFEMYNCCGSAPYGVIHVKNVTGGTRQYRISRYPGKTEAESFTIELVNFNTEKFYVVDSSETFYIRIVDVTIPNLEIIKYVNVDCGGSKNNFLVDYFEGSDVRSKLSNWDNQTTQIFSTSVVGSELVAAHGNVVEGNFTLTVPGVTTTANSLKYSFRVYALDSLDLAGTVGAQDNWSNISVNGTTVFEFNPQFKGFVFDPVRHYPPLYQEFDTGLDDNLNTRLNTAGFKIKSVTPYLSNAKSWTHFSVGSTNYNMPMSQWGSARLITNRRYASPIDRGITAYINGAIDTYDTWADNISETNRLLADLTALGNTGLIVLTAYDALNITTTLRTYLKDNFGAYREKPTMTGNKTTAGDDRWAVNQTRVSWIFIGTKGSRLRPTLELSDPAYALNHEFLQYNSIGDRFYELESDWFNVPSSGTNLQIGHFTGQDQSFEDENIFFSHSKVEFLTSERCPPGFGPLANLPPPFTIVDDVTPKYYIKIRDYYTREYYEGTGNPPVFNIPQGAKIDIELWTEYTPHDTPIPYRIDNLPEVPIEYNGEFFQGLTTGVLDLDTGRNNTKTFLANHGITPRFADFSEVAFQTYGFKEYLWRFYYTATVTLRDLGEYTVTATADNAMRLYINGNQVLQPLEFFYQGSDFYTESRFQYRFTLTKLDWINLYWEVDNYGGPLGAFIEIKDPRGNIIWSTTSQINAPVIPLLSNAGKYGVFLPFQVEDATTHIKKRKSYPIRLTLETLKCSPDATTTTTTRATFGILGVSALTGEPPLIAESPGLLLIPEGRDFLLILSANGPAITSSNKVIPFSLNYGPIVTATDLTFVGGSGTYDSSSGTGTFDLSEPDTAGWRTASLQLRAEIDWSTEGDESVVCTIGSGVLQSTTNPLQFKIKDEYPNIFTQAGWTKKTYTNNMSSFVEGSNTWSGYDAKGIRGSLLETLIVPMSDPEWLPIGGGRCIVEFTGAFVPTQSGTVKFTVADVDDYFVMWIGQTAFENYNIDNASLRVSYKNRKPRTPEVNIPVTAGKPVIIRIQTVNIVGPFYAPFVWTDDLLTDWKPWTGVVFTPDSTNHDKYFK